jgi:hypothetical protein
VRRFAVITLLAATALGAAAAQAAPVAAPPTRVTVIGDSIASAIAFDPASKRVLGRGVELDLQLAVCRRLVGESCPYEGSRPPSLVDLVPTLQLGTTVVVAVGYNDFEATVDDAVEASLRALAKAGVEHVLWLTLRAERQSYLNMNDVIREAATHHPEMTVVDWNLYSRSHPDWFQDDGLHLNSDGSLAMATLVHSKRDELGLVAAPLLKAAKSPLPPGRVGRPYLARLTTSGGTRPVTWALKAGRLPPGVRLLRDGRLRGTPRAAGRTSATVKATDARGQSATRRVVLTIRRR